MTYNTIMSYIWGEATYKFGENINFLYFCDNDDDQQQQQAKLSRCCNNTM